LLNALHDLLWNLLQALGETLERLRQLADHLPRLPEHLSDQLTAGAGRARARLAA
jgi:hypothetical protein